jgi:hypothetical protein
MEVLALNDAVTVDVPDYVMDLIDSYKNEPADAADIFIMQSNAVIGLTPYGQTLENVVIPKTVGGAAVTSLLDTFNNNGTVERVILPDTVKIINRLSFAGAPNLGQVNIPAGVTHIGGGVFDGCTKAVITFEGKAPPTIEDRAFGKNSEGIDTSVKKIIVPADAVEVYKTAFGAVHPEYSAIIFAAE